MKEQNLAVTFEEDGTFSSGPEYFRVSQWNIDGGCLVVAIAGTSNVHYFPLHTIRRITATLDADVMEAPSADYFLGYEHGWKDRGQE